MGLRLSHRFENFISLHSSPCHPDQPPLPLSADQSSEGKTFISRQCSGDQCLLHARCEGQDSPGQPQLRSRQLGGGIEDDLRQLKADEHHVRPGDQQEVETSWHRCLLLPPRICQVFTFTVRVHFHLLVSSMICQVFTFPDFSPDQGCSRTEVFRNLSPALQMPFKIAGFILGKSSR